MGADVECVCCGKRNTIRAIEDLTRNDRIVVVHRASVRTCIKCAKTFCFSCRHGTGICFLCLIKVQPNTAIQQYCCLRRTLLIKD